MYNEGEVIMQDKHFVFVHCKEDRDVLINKIKYPKTVYHVGNDPQPGEIQMSNKQGIEWIYMTWIVDNYDNLPDYTIFSQAIADDHVHEPLLAFESTLTSGFGSFSFARSLYNQYTTDWVRCHPCASLLEKMGLKLTNVNNASKPIFLCYPGVIFYASREKIREKPKSFYEKLIELDNDDTFYEDFLNEKKPGFFYTDSRKYHPDVRGLNNDELFKVRTVRDKTSYFGRTCEALWFYIFASEEMFDRLDTAQACMGNKLYFNLNREKYSLYTKFTPFPFSDDNFYTILNFKMFENDWFDWNCPNYLKWRETLKEKMIWEGQQMGFDGQGLLDYFEQAGYKHISL